MVHLPRTCDRFRNFAGRRGGFVLSLAGILAASVSANGREIPLGRVIAVRVWSLGDVTRIAVQTTGDFRLKCDRLENPDRLFFDLLGASDGIRGKGMHTIRVSDPLVKQVRVAETQRGVTRVVLDLKRFTRFTTSRLDNPQRLMIELRESEAPEGTLASSASPRRFIAPVRTHTPPAIRLDDPPPLAAWEFDAQASPFSSKLFAPRPLGRAPRGKAVAKATPIEDVPPPPIRTADIHTTTVPEQARRGTVERSLTRALGLKVRRVVIDAGHGGHDTGTEGAGGLLEKDLVLDVALRLGKLVQERLGAEVVYTRSGDTFIPLEERTRIANQSRADLFLSIHANSSPLRSASGVETYYLSFTSSQAALAVAARENAASDSSVYELKDLLQRIALQDKIEESREFGDCVQASLYAASLRIDSRSRDRGVKKAPFVVLIGASMPSVLAEVGFISNPRDAAALRRGEPRQRIAEALYKGVAKYSNGLGHFAVAERGAP